MTIQDKYEKLVERYCNVGEALYDDIGSREEKEQLQRELIKLERDLKALERIMNKLNID